MNVYEFTVLFSPTLSVTLSCYLPPLIFLTGFFLPLPISSFLPPFIVHLPIIIIPLSPPSTYPCSFLFPLLTYFPLPIQSSLPACPSPCLPAQSALTSHTLSEHALCLPTSTCLSSHALFLHSFLLHSLLPILTSSPSHSCIFP